MIVDHIFATNVERILASLLEQCILDNYSQVSVI
jgi:hypothetical protein